MSEYRMVEMNEAGRDFVVGDIHGMFDRVQEALSKVNFDRDRDRLFSVGDLIDRGRQSREVGRFLDQPFVHAVCGNHEDALLQMHAGSAQPNSEIWLEGAEWWRELSQTERRAVIARLERLPLVIEVPTPRGNVAFLHADVPRGMNWSDFRDALKSDPGTVRHKVLWSRDRMRRKDDSGVPGIGRVFVGHTPHPDGLRRYGNVYAVDTGAVFGWRGMDGRLTCVEIQSETAGLDELHRVGKFEVDVLDLPAPDRPFGSYAKPRPNCARGE